MPTGISTAVPTSIPTEIPTGLPTSMLTEVPTKSKSDYTMFVNYFQDGLGSCTNRTVTCNLRSAIATCRDNPSGYCDIHLPSRSIISIDSSTYSPLEISSMSSIASSSSRLTIFGQDSTIKCLPEGINNCQSRFLSVSNLNEPTGTLSFHLHNLSIHGFGSSTTIGGALYLQGLNDIVINAVTFIHNIGSNGGALYMTNCSHVIIDNCVFTDNHSVDYGGGFLFDFHNRHITISNNIIESNNAASDGGGFYLNIENNDITIYNNIIQSNIAIKGGGWYIYQYNHHISLSNNQIQSNIANQEGGGIYLDSNNYDITISNNIIQSNIAATNGVNFFGGAVYINNGNTNFLFRGESFVSNYAGFGGGFALGNLNINIILKSCIFSMNEAYTGGAIHIDRLNKAISFDHIVFSNNSATSGDGGAVLVNEYNSLINIDGSTFRGNKASITGGAVCISFFNTDISFKRSFFIGNSAQDGGGISLSTYADNVVLDSVVLDTNEAYNNGGALFVDFKARNLIMRDVLIRNNRAGSYGGGMFFGQQNIFVSCEGCIYRRNIAQIDGGGLYLSESNSELSFSNCIVSQNSAGSSGGGFHAYIQNQHIRMNDVLFTSNVAYDGDGGGVYAGENNSLTLTSCNMTTNLAITRSGSGLFSYIRNKLQIFRSIFRSNVGSQLGTVTLSADHANGAIRRCLFVNNSATSGSAISVSNSKDIVIINSQFYLNYAESNGGSIHIDGVNRIVLGNLQIRNSTAGGNGGGIFITQSSTITLYNNYMNSNRAVHHGGGIYLQKSSTVSIKQCQFSAGVSEYGSAISMSSTTNFSMKSCSFIDNKALAAGTMYWLTSSNMTEPRGLNSSSSIWIGNQAKYGSKYASDSFICRSPTQVFMDRYSGNPSLPVIPVKFYDYYGQRVITENTVTVSVSLDSWDGCTPSILTGTSTVTVVNGTAVFNTLSITCTTEGSLNLKFTSKTDESFYSSTNVQFSTFRPTSSPTMSPTSQQLSASSAGSAVISDSTIIGISVGGTLFLLLFLLVLLWRYVLSPKAVYILDNLPLHKLLVDYSPSNEMRICDLLQSHPEYALKKDYNGKTVLDIIFDDKDSLRVSSEIIFVLLMKTSNLEGKVDLSVDDINGNSSWLVAVQRNDDSTVFAVESLLIGFRKNIDNIRILANATDSTGRTCKDIAGPKCKDIILRKLYLYEQYEINEGPPEHKSATSLVLIGKDHGVADAILWGYEDYPYCIVMEAATQDLKRFIDHENIMNMDIDEKRRIMKQLTCCVDHIHRKQFIHGDVKPLNVLQKGALLTLTDLDASCSIEPGVYTGAKYSSGYLPPEMFWCDPQSGEVKVRIPIQNSNDNSNSYVEKIVDMAQPKIILDVKEITEIKKLKLAIVTLLKDNEMLKAEIENLRCVQIVDHNDVIKNQTTTNDKLRTEIETLHNLDGFNQLETIQDQSKVIEMPRSENMTLRNAWI
eukprot:gene7498-15346_t